MFEQKIERVFTPRSADFNSPLFIERQPWQRNLCENISSDFHGILVGPSGVGKTWLAGKVASSLAANSVTVNCNSHDSPDTLGGMLLASMSGTEGLQKTGQEDEIQTGLAGTHAKSTKIYSAPQREQLRAALEKFKKKQSRGPNLIILENAEQLLRRPSGLDELERFLVFLDNFKDRKSTIKALILVAEVDSARLIRMLRDKPEVRSRTAEINPLVGFSREEVFSFLCRGFQKELSWGHLTDRFLINWANHIEAITFGVPLYVQAYCRTLATHLSSIRGYPPAGILDLIDPIYAEIDSVGVSDQLAEIAELVKSASRKKKILWALVSTSFRGRINFESARNTLQSTFGIKLAGSNSTLIEVLNLVNEAKPKIFYINDRSSLAMWIDPKTYAAFKISLVRRETEILFNI